MPSITELLKVDNISYQVANKKILTNISFTIYQNSFVTITGNNGAGKSTLCKIIANSFKPTTGKIDLSSHCKIKYMPQINSFNILLPITVLRFLLLNNKTSLTEFDLSIIDKLLIKHLYDSQLKDLSGGEKQRVLLARALISDLDLLILDEPSTFIDYQSKSTLYDTISQVQKHKQFSVLLISHDINLVLKKTDWVIHIEKGSLCCQGHPSSISQASLKKIIGNDWQFYQHNQITK